MIQGHKELQPVILPLLLNGKEITEDNYACASYEELRLSHDFRLAIWIANYDLATAATEEAVLYWEATLTGPEGPIGHEGTVEEVLDQDCRFGPYSTRGQAIEAVVAIARRYEPDVAVLPN